MSLRRNRRVGHRIAALQQLPQIDPDHQIVAAVDGAVFRDSITRGRRTARSAARTGKQSAPGDYIQQGRRGIEVEHARMLHVPIMTIRFEPYLSTLTVTVMSL